jgi:F420-dependent oxidoreductase-like protein
MGRMRLCLMVEGQEGVSWETWTSLAAACERAGLEGLFRSDHYLSVVGRRERESHDALATLAGLAATTRVIRLGTLVSPATFRHPSVIAKASATIDHISGGRFELGLGAGWNEPEHAAYGFDFPSLGTRMDLLEEQLEIVRRQWTEESVTFEGQHYRLVDCPALPKPLQQPHPPIIVGGSGGPRSMGLAVRFADEYNTLLAGIDDLRERKARLVEACEAAGRDHTSLPLTLMATCVVGEDHAVLLDRVRGVLVFSGTDDRDPEEVLAERRGRWVAGTPAEVVERLHALEDVGVERVYLQHLAPEDTGMVALVGESVLPAVAG